MSRVKNGPATRSRRNKVLSRAKGFRGARSRSFRIAKAAVIKALTHAYNDRKRKKRYFRALWQIRISAAVKEQGLSYSRFIGALKKANIALDRKVLADLAIYDPKAFQEVVKVAQQAIK